jgi:hypothetical protein
MAFMLEAPKLKSKVPARNQSTRTGLELSPLMAALSTLRHSNHQRLQNNQTTNAFKIIKPPTPSK